LQDIGFKDSKKRMHSAISTKASASKMIVKNNFLRTFVDLDDVPAQTEVRVRPATNYSIKKKHTFAPARPQSEYLVFRTNQKKENLLPDLEKISSKIESYKFGVKSIPAGLQKNNMPLNNASDGNNDNSSERYVDKLKIPQPLSMLKLDMLPTSDESSRPKQNIPDFKYSKGTSASIKHAGALISEEIEFLTQQRTLSQNRASTASENIRNPIRFCEKMSQPENKLPRHNSQEDLDLQKEITLSNRGDRVDIKTQAAQSLKKNLSISKSQTKLVTSCSDDIKPQPLSIDSKKKIMHISPKMESLSMKLVTQTPMMKTQPSFKKESKNVNSNSIYSKTTQDVYTGGSLFEFNSEKPSSLATKLAAMKKEDTQLAVNGPSFTCNHIPVNNDLRANSKGFIFEQRSESNSVGMLTKNHFGNKYWKNTFND